MRVIAGTAGGLQLKCLEGLATRPTADRVKESLFNILNPFIPNCNALDLFAGTGALGIEALSRGAGSCSFVDSSNHAAEIIKQNLEHTKLKDKAQIIVSDAQRFLMTNTQKFDIIFLDPPYKQGLLPGIIGLIDEKSLLNADGMIIAESDVNTPPPDRVGSMAIVREKKYGTVLISFYQEVNI